MESMTRNERFEREAGRLRAARKRETYMTVLMGAGSILIFLLIWQLLCSTGIVDSRLLASPIQVIRAVFVKLTDPRPDGNTLFVNIFASFKLVLYGFLLALVIGLPMGLFMGWYRPFDKLVRPIFEIIRPLPPIAWIPIIIVLMGIGTAAKSFIIFFTSFVPIVINSCTGIRETSQVHINFAKTCGYSNWKIFLTVGIPSAMPLTFAGMVIALGNGWGTLIAAEMLAANKGMGYMIMMGRNYGRIDIIIAGMLVIGLIGLLLTGLIGKLESVVLKWRVKSR